MHSPERPVDPTTIVTALLPRFEFDPQLHLHKLDTARRTALVVVMDENDYGRESFLDDRLLERVKAGVWMPTLSLIDMISAPSRAPHFIFHQGHTGSTLVSRLLDSLGVFGLREPTVLAEVAAIYDRLGQPDALCSRETWDGFLRFMLHVWARTFREDAPSVVKATSHAGRIGAELLQSAPQSRAIALSLSPEPYLAVLLAGPNSSADLRAFAQERMRRLARLFGDVSGPLYALSTGELAAMTWLVERASQVRYLGNPVLASRALDVDFDDFLAEPHAHLTQMSAHFGVSANAQSIDAVLSGPIMSHYSKDPAQPYSLQRRRSTMAASRATNAEEIRKGLRWLEQVSMRSAEAAGVIAFGKEPVRSQALPLAAVS